MSTKLANEKQGENSALEYGVKLWELRRFRVKLQQERYRLQRLQLCKKGKNNGGYKVSK